MRSEKRRKTQSKEKEYSVSSRDGSFLTSSYEQLQALQHTHDEVGALAACTRCRVTGTHEAGAEAGAVAGIAQMVNVWAGAGLVACTGIPQQETDWHCD